MKTQQYLTLRLHNSEYGIEAALVQEIFPLPELILLDEMTPNLIGIINLRGQVIPIIHLDLLQEYSVKSCNISDHVIIIHYQGLQFGMIFHQVNEVLKLNIEATSFSKFSELDTDLVAGTFQAETGDVILLNPDVLISQLNTILPLVWDAQMQLDAVKTAPSYEVEQPDDQLPTKIFANFYDLYCHNSTNEEQAIFRQRANELKLAKDIKITSQLIPLAIISFGDEYFGLDLKLVRAFIDISNFTPIPCCPNHIVGNMNLRGEIITLVDIRKVLNIPISTISIGSQAVLVQVDDIVAGLPVERVLDMVELNRVELSPLANTASNFSKQYIKETALFRGEILSILDLPKIFTQGGIAVNEEV